MRTAVRVLFALPMLGALATGGVAAPASRAVTPAHFDWHQFRLDQSHTGFNRFEHVLDVANVRSLSNTWQAALGDIVLSSSPAVVGGVVYIGSSDGTLFAYPADGCGADLCETPLWQSTNLAQIVDSPTVADGVVYIGSQTSFDSNDGLLSAFAASGCGAPVCAPLWQGVAGKESILESSPAVGGGFVYVGAYDGRLYAFDARGCGAARCRPVWTGATGGSIESSPTVVGGIVYIGSDDGKLYAFAAGGCGRAACAPLWTGDLGSAVFASTPAVANGVVYISSQHALSAFDAHGCGAATCAPLWQAVDDEQFFNGSPAIAYGRVYAGLEYGVAVYAADGCGASQCSPLWLLLAGGFQADVESSPTVANGVVYAGRNTGEVLAWPAEPCGDLVCFNLWSGMTREAIVSSSPTVIDGKLYIGSADNAFPEEISGRLYVFELP
jgi:outer membrane protein assembly factor BamB